MLVFLGSQAVYVNFLQRPLELSGLQNERFSMQGILRNPYLYHVHAYRSQPIGPETKFHVQKVLLQNFYPMPISLVSR